MFFKPWRTDTIVLLPLLLLRSYCPNTIDINTDEAEYRWLLQVLEDQVSPRHWQQSSSSSITGAAAQHMHADAGGPGETCTASKEGCMPYTRATGATVAATAAAAAVALHTHEGSLF
jgi:hypothetical protein